MASPSLGKRRLASLKSAVEKLARTPEADFLPLARALRELQQETPDQFADIAASYGLGRRTAYYLASTWERLAPYTDLHAQLARIGWTKAGVVAEHITPKNASKLLEQAETSTVSQLKASLRGDERDERKHVVLMRFTDSEYRLLKKALEEKDAQPTARGLAGKEQALMKIIREWRRRGRGI